MTNNDAEKLKKLESRLFKAADMLRNNIDERFAELKMEFRKQTREETELNKRILANLKKVQIKERP